MKKSITAKLFVTVILAFLMISAASFSVIQAQLPPAPDPDIYHGTPSTTDRPGVSGYPPPAGANITWEFDVKPRLSFSPNPIGVGQVFIVNIWVTPPPSANRFMKDYKVVITKPDGTSETVTTDSYVADGTSWFPYLADQVGEWTLQFFFIGMYHPPGWWSDGQVFPTFQSGRQWYDGNYYNPAATPVQKLTVQQEFVYSWPMIGLPSDYWNRPISMEHREWAQIGGNYPWSLQEDTIGEYNGAPDYYGPYITAPNTAHIAWKRQGNLAGVTGGEAGVYGELGSPGLPDVIFNGRCYDTRTSFVFNKPVTVAACYDLRTGEIYYAIPISEGGVTPRWIAYDKPADTAVPGAGASRPITATLISVDSTSNPTRLYKINPFSGAVTGNYSLTGAGGPGRIVAFRDSWFLSIRDTSDSVVDPYMISHFWNRTSIQDNGYPTYLYNWSVIPNTNNFASRLTSNTSYRLCPSYRGSAGDEAGAWNWYGRFGAADLDVGYTAVSRRFFDNAVWGGQAVGTSLITGQVVWERYFENAPYSPRTTLTEDGVYVICFNQGEVVGLDVKTGKILWTYNNNSYPFGGFWGYDEASAYGLAYFWSYDGVQAFSLETGDLVWHYNDVAVPFETTYTGRGGEEAYSFNGGGIVADGKVYTRNSEHTATAPYTRGWSMHCLNATTGKLIWKIGNPMDPGPAADGYLTASNSYDGYMYVFGKGKSATTVTAPDVSVPKGTTVLIKGTVLDMSPGQPGTPCVSVDSMATQMNYLHLQRPIDGLFGNETITGVPVVLTAIAEDGTFYDLGSVTTDGYYGTFGLEWDAPAEGKYEIIASFAGDDSYGSSDASTFVSIGPAQSPAGEEPPETGTDNSALLYGILAAVIVAIVIGVVAIFLNLRRR